MPLLSPNTVLAVRGLAIADVVGRAVTLKPKGGNLWGKCPFHDEKSDSFEVHVKDNFYHCFGCGEKGDSIRFAMKTGGLDFVEAVEELARQHNIPIERDETPLTPEQQAAEEKRRQERKEVSDVLEWAATWFAANAIPEDYFTAARGLSETLVQVAGLGYAPAGGRVLLDAANRAGYLAPLLVKASLVREVQKEGRTSYFDFFQDRAMYPLRDARGQTVAFSGRYIGPEVPADQYQPPKAINSDEATWTKGAHFYGLDRAAQHIRKMGSAYLVEGQMDVLQMWQHQLDNTVGQGGTALTDEQIALLKRYTDHAILCYDNDTAGRKALHANGPRLLAAGFKVSVLVPAEAEQVGRVNSDPDTFLRSIPKTAAAEVNRKSKKKVTRALDSDGNKMTVEQYTEFLLAEWNHSQADFITHYALPEAQKSEALGVRERSAAIMALGELLESLPNQVERIGYYEEIAGLWGAFKKGFKLAKRKAEPALEVKKETKDALARLTAEEMTASMDEGFFERKGGYWYYDGQKGRDLCICEFTIDFLFFVVSNNRPKYVCNLTNSFGRVRLGTFSTDDFVSKDGFNKAIGRYHGFVFEGSQHHLNRIKIKRWAGCREAIEANYLGWNDATGVYAWNNGLLQGSTFYPCDKYGVVTLEKPVPDLDTLLKLSHETQLRVDGTVPVLNTPAEIVDKVGGEETITELLTAGKVIALNYHYLPSGGSIQLGGDESDDLAKKFKHFNTGNLSFTEWASLMVNAHGEENGRTMVAFFIASLFRSIIHKANNGYFPILFQFGQPGSGKSQASLALMYMFGTPPHDDGIGLESGSTTTGMQRFLSSYADAIVWLNEYKNTLPVRTIGTLKDLAGGSGKMTGMNTTGNETKTTPPRSAAIISGQDLPTADAALLERCIINTYDKRGHDHEAWKTLTDIQKAGHTTAVTCEVLAHRPIIAAGYKKMEATCTTELRVAGKQLLGEEPNSRAVLNLTSILAPCRLMMEAGVEFPFSYEELKGSLLTKMARTADIQDSSDEVETFFLTLATLPEMLCKENEHYKIEKDTQNRIVFYLRTKHVHGAYASALKNQGGNAMGISALRDYMEKHRTFLGEIKNTRFASENVPNATSALMFDYTKLREQGIEFRTKVNLKNAPVTVKEVLDEAEAPKTTVTAENLNELVDKFLGSLAITEAAPVRKFTPGAIYDAFSHDKANRFDTNAFLAALRLGEAIPTPGGLRTVRETWPGHDQSVPRDMATQFFYEVTEGRLPF
jgi:DNA primase catalytic core